MTEKKDKEATTASKSGDDDGKTTRSRPDPPPEKDDTEETHPGSPWKWIVLALALWAFGIAFYYVIQQEVKDYQEETGEPFSFEGALGRTLQQLEQRMQRFNGSAPEQYLMQESNRPGFRLAQQHGARAKHPIVMIPGFVTSGLELWGGQPCARKHFRQRLWACFGLVRHVLAERDCWKQHMSLDPYTGSDPFDGKIKIRASEGFGAADYFVHNYWIWGKVIENLADVGYNPNNMALEPYDWRLAFPLLETRDGYFTRLRMRVEALYKANKGVKVVLASHSMGALVVHYFLAWVTTPEEQGGGGGGADWADTYLHAYVNIAGPHLGVPKAAAALLSGEMSDTVFLEPIAAVVEQLFGRTLRRDLFSTWGSLWSMLPKGGNALWGPGADFCSEEQRASGADPLCPDPKQQSPVLTFAKDEAAGECQVKEDGSQQCTAIPPPAENDLASKEHLSTEDVLDFLTAHGGGLGPDTASTRLLSLYGTNDGALHRQWHDPTRTPLPNAPNMKIYCLYGVGLKTERAYYYKRNPGEGGKLNVTDNNENSSSNSSTSAVDPPVLLDTSIHREDQNVSYGVRYAMGDGAVPLLSLGYMCADAWRRPSSGLNPSAMRVITREYPDNSNLFQSDDPGRKGPYTAEHVDFMGNVDMMQDFLRVVTDYEPAIESKFHSNIREIADAINKHPSGGLGTIEEQ